MPTSWCSTPAPTPSPTNAGATLEAKSGATLEIDSNVTNTGATIKADNGGTLELVNDTITGGTIALNGATTATTLQIEGTVTLAAGTTLTLTDYANNAIVSTHDEVAGAAKLINHGTISGAGTIGDTTGGINLTLDNFGDIAAGGAIAFANELVLNTGTNAITNESGATLEAKSGATLEIDSDVSNTGATIKANNGGTLELVSDTITGGTIALNGATTATTLQIEGTVTLATGTTLTLTDYANNAIVSTHDEVAGAAKLINRGTISGAGTIGDTTGGINLTLDNFGDIAAGGAIAFANELMLNTGTNAITNEAGATLEAKSGATLEIDSDVSNTGATIKANDGGTLELVSDTVTGGTIALNGATTATTLQIEGTVTLATGTTLTLTDYANNAIVSTHDEVAGAAKLINRGTISGAGTIGDTTGGINLTLDNFGDIAAGGAIAFANELVLNTGTNAITNESAPPWRRRAGRRWRSTATSATPAPPSRPMTAARSSWSATPSPAARSRSTARPRRRCWRSPAR